MPEVPPETSVWQRIARDIVRPSRSQLVVALILLLSGLAVTMQLAGNRDQRYTTLRQDELVAMLDDVTAESRRLESEVAELERTRQRLQSGADASAVARNEALRRLDALELLGGTAPATGPGIRVTITDRQGKLTPDILLNTIEELRDAGAEVMEIDDRIRLVTTSWVTSADGVLTVDGTRLGGTITIEAIGAPGTLAEATRFRGGLVSTIEGERVGGTARVVEVDDLRIDSVVTPQEPRFARPA
ncbi:DUF881 domain-containing protein [Propioniciclava sinopodophylli]|uniref:DUF881 domain-containing protein n=1 Tax=Propioniciclava sinopodophylli TaxID=1837344 RepID=A0A4V2JSI7_9ACTN|nr:DUF881 domain-containing protein [Propioniciclava sinopodophylli]TBT85364.1 DUF881 domain-containing protein [Propioniciclava sinopodophylli]